jgi:hypothetical protein
MARQPNSRRSAATWAMIGALVGLSLVFAWAGPRPPRSTPATEAGVQHSVQLSSNGPFLHGTRYAGLGQLQTAIGVNVPRPGDSLAKDSLLTDAWADTTSGLIQVRLDYSTGVSVDIEQAQPAMTDPAAALQRFQAMASQDAYSTGGQAQVTTVNGGPAYLIPQNAARYANGVSQGAPGEVEFVFNGYVIDVFGHFSNDDLIRVASSVSIPSTQ